jgi:hypothetical protein
MACCSRRTESIEDVLLAFGSRRQSIHLLAQQGRSWYLHYVDLDLDLESDLVPVLSRDHLALAFSMLSLMDASSSVRVG